MKILITGANGMVGQAVLEKLIEKHEVHAAIRQGKYQGGANAVSIAVGNIDSNTVWDDALQGIDVIVHTAARVHQVHDVTDEPLAEFMRVNCDGTLVLARAAAKYGVKRFVFLSTIKVNGEETVFGKAFTETDLAAPHDGYAISKLKAELGLREIGATSGMEIVILRLPLVYGPKVKANFLKLIQMVDKGIPMPFGKLANKRSLIYLGNLVDAVSTCIAHPNAGGKTYLVSDQQDVSTPELIRKIATALGRSPVLLFIPVNLLKFGGRLLRKEAQVRRLLGSLVIDSKMISRDLGWKPPFSMEYGLQQTVQWYLKK